MARLQKALLEARREAETLSVALENPGNQSRWRLLEGKIPGEPSGRDKLREGPTQSILSSLVTNVAAVSPVI